MSNDKYDALSMDRAERREARLKENWILLDEAREAGLVWDPRGSDSQGRPVTLLFRITSKPFVDFYPGTGRWKVVGPPHRGDWGKVFRGGAKAFLAWYERQT